MNNDNNSPITPVDNNIQPPVPNPVETPVLATPKSSRSRLKIALFLALLLFLLALIPLAYYLGQMNSLNKLAEGISSEVPANIKPAESLPEQSTPIADPYADWKTYTNPVHGYSFKYPSDWQVDRKVVQEPADWVSINPAGTANPGINDLLAIVTYLDGTGCGQVVTKQFIIGGTAVEGRSDCGDPMYTVAMKKAGADSVKGNQVAVKVNTNRGEDKTIELILESISSLTPSGT